LKEKLLGPEENGSTTIELKYPLPTSFFPNNFITMIQGAVSEPHITGEEIYLLSKHYSLLNQLIVPKKSDEF